MTKKIVCVLTSLVLLLALAPLAVSADGDSAEFTDHYGRNALSALDNAAALVYAYDRIAEAVGEYAAGCDVFDGVHPLSMGELGTVMDAYRRDFIQHFWLGVNYSISYNSQTVVRVTFNYIMTAEAKAAAEAELEAAIGEILAGLEPGMSDFETELYFHDLLCSTVEYKESANCRNVYGALVEHVAVCEGYAEAFQTLLNRVGIPTFTAIGVSDNPLTGVSEGHEWSYVQIGGKWYHVDVTWDDQGDAFHSYFNLSDAATAEDHQLDSTAYALPVCDSDDAFYFNVTGTKTTTYDVASIAALMKDNDMSAVVYISSGVDEFVEWFFRNAGAIGSAAGITGSFGCSYLALDKEARVRFTVALAGVSLPATLDLTVGDTAVLTPEFRPEYATNRKVTWTNTDESAVSIADDGTVTALAKGEADITVTTDDGAFTATCRVTVTVPADLLAGDADGSGSVNARDVILIMKYLVGYTAENAPELASLDAFAADFDGNGRINNRDVIMIMLAITNGEI